VIRLLAEWESKARLKRLRAKSFLDEVEVVVLMPKSELVMFRTSLDLNVRQGNVDASTDTSAVDFGGVSPAIVGELKHPAESHEVLEFAVLSFSSDSAVKFGPDHDSHRQLAIEDELRESVGTLFWKIFPEKGNAD
jgi:hypothetical protein